MLMHGKGIAAETLAHFHMVMAEIGWSRFLGIGKDQYGTGGKQLFEDMTAEQLRKGYLEELVDAQNYLSMLAIKELAALKEEEK